MKLAADGSFSLGLRIDGVAGRDRDRDHPHRHHRREVERRDPGDDAERLADRVHVDPARDLAGEPALEQVRHAARELDDLEPAGHLAQRVGAHLAVLGGDDRGELGLAGVEELAEREQDGRTPGQRRRAPAPAGLGRSLDCRVDHGTRRERDLPRHLAGGRVVHVADASRVGGPGTAVDPVPDQIERGEVCHRASPTACSASIRISSPSRASSSVKVIGGATRRQLP